MARIASMWCDITGYLDAISIVLGAWIPAYHRLKGYTSKLVAIAVFSLFLAVFVPLIVDYLLATTNLIAAAIVALIGMAAVSVAGLWAFFLPMRIALKRDREHARPVIIVNLLIFIPFSWHLALLWATAPEREQGFTGPTSTHGPAINTDFRLISSSTKIPCISPQENLRRCFESLTQSRKPNG